MTKREWKTLSITEKALLQRLNRAFAKNDQVLRKSRPASRTEAEHGAYFTINTRINGIVGDFVETEAIGRALGALNPFEALATNGAGR